MTVVNLIWSKSLFSYEHNTSRRILGNYVEVNKAEAETEGICLGI